MTAVGPELLLDIARRRYTEAEVRRIQRAYLVAAFWHRDQRRRSGDPYISHPTAVAIMLAGLEMDANTVCAGLLHDVIEDTDCGMEDIRGEFGSEVAGLVADFVKLNDVPSAHDALAAADGGALVIKLADRLHNMRTLKFMPPAKQERKARETLAVFAPLANRLGLNAVKAELERLALATLYPAVYTKADLRLSRRLLVATTVLLPHPVRARWLEEWMAELHVLPNRRARIRFTAQVINGMCRLAIVLRRPVTGERSDRT